MGYDDAETVDATAEAEHDQGVAACRAREGGLHHRLAEHLRDCKRSPQRGRSPQDGATGDGEVVAAALLVNIGVSHACPQVVMCWGVSKMDMTRRG